MAWIFWFGNWRFVVAGCDADVCKYSTTFTGKQSTKKWRLMILFPFQKRLPMLIWVRITLLPHQI